MASYLDAGAIIASGLVVGGFYADALNLNAAGTGLLLGAHTFAFATGAIAGGRAGDRLGRRRVLVASLVLYAAGVALLASAWSVSSLALGLVISGLAIGADLPTSLAMVGESAPAGAKGRAIAFTQALWVVGIAATGLLGVLLADLGATAGRLIYLHLLVVAVVVLAFRMELKESPEWAREMQRLRNAAPTPTRGTGPLIRLDLLASATGLSAISLAVYYTAWNLGANTLGQFKTYLWIKAMDGTERGAAVLILLGIPVGLSLSVVFALLADGRRRHRWIVSGALISTAGWLAVAIWPTPQGFIILVVCFAAGAPFSGETAFKLWTQQLLPTLHRAAVQGTALAVARVVAAAAAVFTPAVALESPRSLFVTLFVLSALSTAIATWWIPRLDRHHRPPAW